MVLVDFHWRTTMQKLGIPENVIDTLDRNMVNHPLWNHFDLDDIPESELIQKFKELSPECSEYIDLFMNNLDDVVDMFPDADKWLKSLKTEDITYTCCPTIREDCSHFTLRDSTFFLIQTEESCHTSAT